MIPLALFLGSLRPPPPIKPVATTTTVATPAPLHSYVLQETAINDRMTVFIGSGVTPAEASSTSFAVSQVNTIAGTHWVIGYGDGHVSPHQIQVQIGDTSQCTVGDLGCTKTVINDGANLWASVTLTPGPVPVASVTWLLLHEFGHAAGIDHVQTADVMRPGLSTYGTYQAGDIAGLRLLRRLP